MTLQKNSPFGLEPVQTLSASNYTSSVMAFPLPSGYNQNIFINDPVVLDTTTGGIRVINTQQDLAPAAIQQCRILGTVASIEYAANVGGYVLNNPARYWRAGTVTNDGTPARVMVNCDPNTIYRVRTSTSVGATNNVWAGASKFAPGRYLNLAIGTSNAAGINNGTPFPDGVMYSDGTFLKNNPTTGNIVTGISSFYADINTAATETAAGGAAPAADNNSRSYMHLRVIGLESLAADLSYGAGAPAMPSGWATAPYLNNTTNPPSVSPGSFNVILVKINNHAFGSL